MAIFVNTNVSSLRGRNYLDNVNNALNTTYQRLSSGLRINSAKDDAAGLQISDRLTTQINGLNQGNRNANDAIALAQTMEGGLDEITNMLQRVRTLAVQASNGINTQEDRDALTQEAKSLSEEITRIATETTYGGKTILAGYDGTKSTSIYNGTSGQNSTVASGSKETGQITFQVGANSGDTINLDVYKFQLSFIALRANGGNALNEAGGTNPFAKDNGVFYFNFSTAAAASSVIDFVDKMLKDVDTQRSTLGAIQNRLESSIRVQSNVATNTSDARSRIRDTDFAEESANLSQQSIIQQAATSMLMQANARPQLGLSLLG